MPGGMPQYACGGQRMGQTWVVRLSGWCLYLLRHLAGQVAHVLKCKIHKAKRLAVIESSVKGEIPGHSTNNLDYVTLTTSLSFSACYMYGENYSACPACLTREGWI